MTEFQVGDRVYLKRDLDRGYTHVGEVFRCFATEWGTEPYYSVRFSYGYGSFRIEELIGVPEGDLLRALKGVS